MFNTFIKILGWIMLGVLVVLVSVVLIPLLPVLIIPALCIGVGIIIGKLSSKKRQGGKA